MRVLIWHVHGSWTTAFVQGPHTYLLPVTPDRGPDGLGRAAHLDWPETPSRCRPSGSATRTSTWSSCSAPTRSGSSRSGWAAGPGWTCPRCTSSTTRRGATFRDAAPHGGPAETSSSTSRTSTG